jgi:hypothetical protein
MMDGTVRTQTRILGGFACCVVGNVCGCGRSILPAALET